MPKKNPRVHAVMVNRIVNDFVSYVAIEISEDLDGDKSNVVCVKGMPEGFSSGLLVVRETEQRASDNKHETYCFWEVVDEGA